MGDPVFETADRDPRRAGATADETRSSKTVRRRLVVGRADDPLERDADRVATAVLGRLPSTTSDARPAPAPAAVGARVSRIVARAPAVAAAGPAGGVVDGALESRIRAATGRGAPLDDGVRRRMETGFGADFGAVRIHARSTLPPEVGATAFTAGADVHFSDGAFDTRSDSGLELLAHELAHVVQQGGGLSADPLTARRTRIQRKGATERQQHERERVWRERLQAQLGISGADATTLANAFARTATPITVLEELGLLMATGWTAAEVVTLVRRFIGDPGGLSAAQWKTVASAAGAANQAAVVATFARAGNGWTAGALRTLVGNFIALPGNIDAGQWVQLARATDDVANQTADVTAYARLAGWGFPGKLALVQAGPGPLDVTQFLALAAAHPGLANNHADVVRFAQLAGWSPAGKLALAAGWAANSGTLDAAQCESVATAHAGLANDSAAVLGFVRLAGWSAANKATLAGLFGAAAARLPAADWLTIAGAHGSLVDDPPLVAAVATAMHAEPVLFATANDARTALATPLINRRPQRLLTVVRALPGWTLGNLNTVLTWAGYANYDELKKLVEHPKTASVARVVGWLTHVHLTTNVANTFGNQLLSALRSPKVENGAQLDYLLGFYDLGQILSWLGQPWATRDGAHKTPVNGRIPLNRVPGTGTTAGQRYTADKWSNASANKVYHLSMSFKIDGHLARYDGMHVSWRPENAKDKPSDPRQWFTVNNGHVTIGNRSGGATIAMGNEAIALMRTMLVKLNCYE